MRIMRLLAILLAFYITLEISDKQGAISIELPVSKEYYDQVYVRQRIRASSRSGGYAYSRGKQVIITRKTERP